MVLPDGRYGVVCHFYDLSERQRHEEYIGLLMRETTHRSKNLLQLVQAVADNTAARSPADFARKFSRRIQALAAGQDLLLETRWGGVVLEDLIRSQLAHFEGQIGARISLSGPRLVLRPESAQTIGMALHELGTNASKYGALSDDRGRIAIEWSMPPTGSGEDAFRLSWTERGGPAVVVPERKGYGEMVIRTMIERRFAATVVLDYAPAGVSWTLTCALSAVADPGVTVGHRSRDARAGRAAPQTRGAVGAGVGRVLVVEDEAMIALHIQQMLEDAGYRVLGPACSVEQAWALLDRESCECAVLDIDLGGETSDPVATRLTENGIPFVVVSSFERSQQTRPFRNAPLVTKPVRKEALLEALSGLIR